MNSEIAFYTANWIAEGERKPALMQLPDGSLLLLASDASSCMTGTVSPVDSGHLVSTL